MSDIEMKKFPIFKNLTKEEYIQVCEYFKEIMTDYYYEEPLYFKWYDFYLGLDEIVDEYSKFLFNYRLFNADINKENVNFNYCRIFESYIWHSLKIFSSIRYMLQKGCVETSIMSTRSLFELTGVIWLLQTKYDLNIDMDETYRIFACYSKLLNPKKKESGFTRFEWLKIAFKDLKSIDTKDFTINKIISLAKCPIENISDFYQMSSKYIHSDISVVPHYKDEAFKIFDLLDLNLSSQRISGEINRIYNTMAGADNFIYELLYIVWVLANSNALMYKKVNENIDNKDIDKNLLKFGEKLLDAYKVFNKINDPNYDEKNFKKKYSKFKTLIKEK